MQRKRSNWKNEKMLSRFPSFVHQDFHKARTKPQHEGYRGTMA